MENFNAEEARKIAYSKNDIDELNGILQLIKEKAEKGYYCVFIHKYISDEVKNQLMKRKFIIITIQHINGAEIRWDCINETL